MAAAEALWKTLSPLNMLQCEASGTIELMHSLKFLNKLENTEDYEGAFDSIQNGVQEESYLDDEDNFKEIFSNTTDIYFLRIVDQMAHVNQESSDDIVLSPHQGSAQSDYHLYDSKQIDKYYSLLGEQSSPNDMERYLPLGFPAISTRNIRKAIESIEKDEMIKQ